MKIYLCIDDTDNIDSIGTGEILENLCAALHTAGFGEGGFVTRHQLYIHEDIAYTSHNSSMCCEVVINDKDLDKVIAFAGAYLQQHSADGSDPGLCIAAADLDKIDELVNFGLRAKQEVLTQDAAFAVAKLYGCHVHLSNHGGNGDGVIGALAGVGLRFCGMDGKVKGKLQPEIPGERMSLTDFCHKYGIQRVIDENNNEISGSEDVIFAEETKAIFRYGQTTVCVKKTADGWQPLGRKEIKAKCL